MTQVRELIESHGHHEEDNDQRGAGRTFFQPIPVACIDPVGEKAGGEESQLEWREIVLRDFGESGIDPTRKENGHGNVAKDDGDEPPDL